MIKYGYITVITWIIGLLLASPISIYQKLVEFGVPGLVTYNKCMEIWPYNIRGIYSFVLLLAQLLIPSSVMLVSHHRIRQHLNANRINKSIDEKQRNIQPSDRFNGNNNEILRYDRYLCNI